MPEPDGFEAFGKIPRWSKSGLMCITEKIDGTNAQIHITPDGTIRAGSRNRYLTPDNDNFGFARWVEEHRDELSALGPGRHYGEWYGSGIQRRYGLDEKRFALFDVDWWESGMEPARPACCDVVPVLYRGIIESEAIDRAMHELAHSGSHAVPGFMNPEGIVIYFYQGRTLFKKTFEDTHKCNTSSSASP